MDFKRLANFVRIAELGSISRAAERMRIAQPALSRQMQILEEEVGVPLFARHRRGMALTEAGEELRSRLCGPLRQIEQVFEDVRALSQAVGGNIAFGMPPTASYVLAGPLARSVVAHAPNVSLRVVEGYGAHLIDWLQRGELDAALLYGPASDFHLKAEELLHEEIRLVGPPDSDLDPAIAVSFDALARLPMVLPSHPHGLRVIADNAAAKARIRLDVRFQADSFLLMKELVESGLGYTLLPLSAFSREAEAGRLRHAPFEKPGIARQLVLVTQPGNSASRATRVLGTLVRREIAALVAAGRWKAHLMYDLEDYPAPVPGR
jgi:LysR family nitrogen assimilation transcriptional regulator